MSKMKKVLFMCTAYVLVAALAIGGTLAYLTDRDSEVNTFTVGDVAIDLTENFEQGAELLPGVRVEKEVSIKNTGKNDAWVWYTYAVPTALVDSGNNSYKNAVHFDMRISTWDTYREKEAYWLEGQTEAVPLEQTWHYESTVHNIKTVVDGVDYTISTFLYNGTLAPNTTTTVSLEKVYLDKCVDITPDGDWYWVENGNTTSLNWNTETNGVPMIYVSAYAIQANEFETVQDAYAAYNKQWGENGSEYPTVVTTAAGLRDAMKTDGANIVIANDIIVTSEDTTGYGHHMFLANGKKVTVDLNGYNIILSEDASQVGSLFSTANGGSITIKGDGNVEVKNNKAFVCWSMNAPDQINIYGGNYFGNGHVGNNALIYVQSGKIDVYGGKFTYPVADNDNWGFNAHNSLGNNLVIEIHEGVLLQHEQFQYGDNSRIQLAEGCSLKETVIDGETWYTVVAE